MPYFYKWFTGFTKYRASNSATAQTRACSCDQCTKHDSVWLQSHVPASILHHDFNNGQEPRASVVSLSLLMWLPFPKKLYNLL